MKYIKYLLLLSLSSCLILSNDNIKPPEDHLLQPLFIKAPEPVIDKTPWQIKLPEAKFGSINAKVSNIEHRSSISVSSKPILSAIAVEKDIVFLNDNGLISRITNVGGSVWSRNVTSSRNYGHLLLLDNIIVAVTGTTKLYAFDATNGNIIWEKDLFAPIHSSGIRIDTSSFLATTIENTLYKIDVQSGEILWSNDNSPPSLQRISHQHPVYHNGKIILPPNDNELVAIEAEDGNKLWEASLSSDYQSSFLYSSYSTPIVLGNIILTSNYTGKTEAFNIESGQKKWQQSISIKRQPMTFANTIFAITEDKHLIALMNDGKLKWRVPIDEAQYGPILCNNLLWLFNKKGKAHGYKVQTGEQVDSIDIPLNLSYQPFILNDSIYSFDKNGNLLIIGGK